MLVGADADDLARDDPSALEQRVATEEWQVDGGRIDGGTQRCHPVEEDRQSVDEGHVVVGVERARQWRADVAAADDDDAARCGGGHVQLRSRVGQWAAAGMGSGSFVVASGFSGSRKASTTPTANTGTR